MSYFVVVTFDIENETSPTYSKVENELFEYGLYDQVIGQSGKDIDLPSNTYAGEFDGGSVSKIREDVANTVQEIFRANQIKGKIFVTVGKNWAWGVRST